MCVYVCVYVCVFVCMISCTCCVCIEGPPWHNIWEAGGMYTFPQVCLRLLLIKSRWWVEQLIILLIAGIKSR